ncbi:MAG: sigma-54 factor interaction domain-containing protein, partial [Acidobacteria bacterium]|nr:sigma-54 factor interaction domain-containing protein [Acidobacteriota bacterium]
IHEPDGKESRRELPDLPDDFIFESRSMRQLVETVAVVAPSDAPILIQGPSGAGKELIAQLLHQWSPRAPNPLVTTNCAGLSETLIESELFGHKKGAFTGATEDRVGLFRTASGGSLFLDEIGEMPLQMQPKLLRVLETNEVSPVGSDRTVDVDTRLIAATNRNLMEEVKAGSFREDLYYRLNVVELVLPSLSDRRE